MYDEFFFNNPVATAAAGGTVQRSDWTQVPVGMMFLGLDPDGSGGTANQWHYAQSGDLILDDNVVRESQVGSRIVFTPEEIHPWNHFSATTVNHAINFFDYAMGQPAPIPAGNQIWQWKVLFNFITMIGYFMLIIPLAGALLKLPFFKLAVSEKQDPVPMGNKPKHKVIYWIAIAVGALLPAYLIPMLMERRVSELVIMGNIALGAAVGTLALSIWAFATAKGCEKKKTIGTGGLVTSAIFVVIQLITANPTNVLNLSANFMAPAVNTIGYWAIMSGVITALILTLTHFDLKAFLGARAGNYGLVAKGEVIVASLATAVVTLVIIYILVFLMQLIFVVDARIWTLAIRSLTGEHILAALRYMPFFFIFYFFNTIAVNANTQGRKFGILIAITLNIGGLVLWLAIQYGVLFSTGVAWYPTMALNAILLFALVPCLAIAAVYANKLYTKTNNVYLAAFINTMFFTLIILANTAVFWNMV